VAELPHKRWMFTSADIDQAVQRIRDQELEGVVS